MGGEVVEEGAAVVGEKARVEAMAPGEPSPWFPAWFLLFFREVSIEHLLVYREYS
jgi:hypothetical protein